MKKTSDIVEAIIDRVLEERMSEARLLQTVKAGVVSGPHSPRQLAKRPPISQPQNAI